jgi:hypothetical protein
VPVTALRSITTDANVMLEEGTYNLYREKFLGGDYLLLILEAR